MKRKHAFLWIVMGLLVLAGCDNRSFNSGDRVLVSKFLYDTDLSEPTRYDVVVFKYPKGPLENGVPKNYIKRLLGLPGQILAIFFGKLFGWMPGPGDDAPPFDDKDVDPNDRWQAQCMHEDEDPAHAWFHLPGKFKILRKPPDVMMAMRRLVYDNDFPAKDMTLHPRWKPGEATGWQADNRDGFLTPGERKEKIDWLRYQHVLRPLDGGPIVGNRPIKPELISDFMDYNSFVTQPGGGDSTPNPNWVGDLMLECQLDVQKAEGEFWLELSKGSFRYQARWELASGMCQLFKVEYETEEVDPGNPREKYLQIKRDAQGRFAVKNTSKLGDPQATKIKAPGQYQVRLANVDARLTLWVDRELPFGDGFDYPPPEIRAKDEKDLSDADLQRRRGPTENDLEPAGIGSKGAGVQVHHLRLWRDTYYTLGPRGSDAHVESWSDVKKWGPLQRLKYKTLYVQPGHYLCLGDNSPSSSDSREWGLVPERLLLGRALLVYYPFNRAGAIR